ncbi:MAG: hypothetical protein PHQ80_00155 [Candidatus ainarchaeum sp.]|nr:hypothetical protein [Candidatus ainarchaeum sp.]MDD5096777.1 hypothetical protein [Candidatus ainarchaeum sp.]
MNTELVKKGRAEAHIRIAGLLQLHPFIVVREKTAFGEIPVLVPEKKVILPLTEAIKVANELDLPVRCASGLVFPTGKFARDFAMK